MLEKYYRERIHAGYSGANGDNCWMEVESHRLVYVTATPVICRGWGLTEDINGEMGLVVHADVKDSLYRVRFEDTALGERTVDARNAIMLFADDE